MKLLDAIEQLIKNPQLHDLNFSIQDELAQISAAHQFLYGEPYSETKKPVSKAAVDLLEKLGLAGDDFSYVDRGANATVYGNQHVVFRLAENEPLGNNDLPIKDIPRGFAAQIHSEGLCNGVAYRVAERLNTELSPSVEEMIPFLFKLRDKGVVYTDAAGVNFGFDAQDNIKILDHEGLQKHDIPKGNFERSLKNALQSDDFPLYASDEHNTYVAFAPQPSGIMKPLKSRVEAFKRTPGLQRLLFDTLEAAGIHKGDMEIIEDPPVVKIPQTEITHGTPPKTESLEDFIYKSLKPALKQPSAGPGNRGVF